MIQDLIHRQICKNIDAVKEWFREQRKGKLFPVYASFDIRDSGFKIAPVDANIFPAGFNNICEVDREAAPPLFQNYLARHYDEQIKNIAVLTEEHTQNPYYWDNVCAIVQIIEKSGFDVRVVWPKSECAVLESASGRKIEVHCFNVENNILKVKDWSAELIICNNDFSGQVPQGLKELLAPINPPFELGWHQRRKENFFVEYNKLVESFSEVIQINADVLKVKTEGFAHFDINSEESREHLGDKVDQFIDGLKETYKELQIDTEPFVFIKNNSGTYGLGVTKVKSGKEVASWNNKTRKKMKAVKGGGEISSVIIQEGIPTRFVEDGVTAEPTLYLLGHKLVGGFLRSHNQKGPDENLNSPGAVFKRLCVSDLKVNISGSPMENVYGWLAKIGLLAIAEEVSKGNVQFRGYKP